VKTKRGRAQVLTLDEVSGLVVLSALSGFAAKEVWRRHEHLRIRRMLLIQAIVFTALYLTVAGSGIASLMMEMTACALASITLVLCLVGLADERRGGILALTARKLLVAPSSQVRNG
jgi:nitroreductase